MVPALGHPVLATARLRLRRWRDGDLEAFAALNADPQVMAQFPAPLSRAESAFVLAQIEAGFERHGFGIWCVETRPEGAFVGIVGLTSVPFDERFTPAVEIGWRLLPAAWGHGYATEAASAALDYGFGEAGLEAVVSFASKTNARSIAVMERLGMRRVADGDFDHPLMERGHPLAPHVLYRVGAEEWAGRGA
ncbi:MAG TPA: GNAT family N-acetyltransferase [Solirubrobacteraceae bacterium]|nr:GNAT family N-acetyltransferase [Solirubrobacteraceae bacterium]